MAKKCRYCKEEMNSGATTCNHCGKDQPKKSFFHRIIILFFGVTFASIFLCIFGFFLMIGTGKLTWRESTDKLSAKGNISARPTKHTKPSYVHLRALIEFDGAQFKIANNDSFDWTSVKMEINSKFLSSGFVLRTPRLNAHNIYTVGAMQFAKKDGQKFNPYTHKVQTFVIRSDTPKGIGLYNGKFFNGTSVDIFSDH